MNKNLYKLVSVVVLIGLLVGCAPQPTQAPQPPAATEAPVATQAPEQPAAPEAPAQPEAPSAGAYEPIVVACWSSPEYENLAKVAAEYEKITGNKVILEEIAREAYYDKLTTTFVGGGSDYDVAYVSSDWIPSWVEAGALQDLTTFIEDPNVAKPDLDLAVYGKTLEYFTFDNKLYVFPSEGDTAWLWYRKDLF